MEPMEAIERTVKSYPLDEAFEILGGKWKARTISSLGERTLRFGELERLIPAASRKVLVQQLRSLEADGVLRRTAYPGVPPRVEYTLTERGRKLLPIFRALESWGAEAAAEPPQSRLTTIAPAAEPTQSRLTTIAPDLSLSRSTAA
jgi:DNA-binding HxlR family transcriptional regulator